MRPATILVRRAGHGLLPADAQAEAALQRLPRRKPFTIRPWRERSHAENALYWRTLECVVEATGRWRTADELHAALKVACGLVDVVQLVDGRRILAPGSIAFDRMSQDEAGRYYEAAFRVICDEIMGGMSVEELLANAAPRREAA